MADKKTELKLPDEISASVQSNPRDLVVISSPKMGKGTILGSFTTNHNALVLDLERGGYEYIAARKMSIYPSDTTSFTEAFENYIKIRNLLFENKGKYQYLIIDGLSDLDVMAEYGGTKLYQNSPVGKNFNRELIKGQPSGKIYDIEDAEYKSVTTLPDGNGYQWTRKWFLQQIEIFRQISPYRLYAAHVADKYIKDNGRDEVVGSEIALTGKLKTMFASKVTALAKLIADDDKRYLNFEVLNDAIIAGSRNPKLKGKILISEKQKDDTIKTFWDLIYN